MSITVKQQALTRPRFDDFHQEDDMRITSYALKYYVNPPDANCPTTFPVDATVRLQHSGRVVNGVGADPDIVVASAKAYLSALNKLQSQAERVAAQG